jgi:DNA modification methylase
VIPALVRPCVSLYLGSCLEISDVTPENSIDAIVTDPPYELGFMGKKWDASGIAFNPDVWREMYRVLKPGGHLLAFGGTRTYHRMAVAIEDAGFEIRDSLHWIYGTGFPKSLDVSKAIDACVTGTNQKRQPENRSEGVPNPRAAQQTSKRGTTTLNDYIGGPAMLMSAGSPEAAAWEGWGTALKPGHEPIVLARKPLEGTVAANVLAHGTGALNIDACRIGTSKDVPASAAKDRENLSKGAEKGRTADTSGFDPNIGRWPANVLLDEGAAAELDAQSGYLTGCGNKKPRSAGGEREAGAIGFGTYGNGPSTIHDRGGGASRFFYVAKPARKERDLGCDSKNIHPTVKPVTLMRYLVRLITPPGGTVLDPFAGSCTTGVAAVAEGFKFLGVELNQEYIEIARARLENALEDARRLV